MPSLENWELWVKDLNSPHTSSAQTLTNKLTHLWLTNMYTCTWKNMSIAKIEFKERKPTSPRHTTHIHHLASSWWVKDLYTCVLCNMYLYCMYMYSFLGRGKLSTIIVVLSIHKWIFQHLVVVYQPIDK